MESMSERRAKMPRMYIRQSWLSSYMAGLIMKDMKRCVDGDVCEKCK